MDDAGLEGAAALFRALSSPSRLAILRALGDEQRTVSELVTATGQSQPLVSQHLRTLRAAGLVDVERSGREANYRVSDQHVQHVVADAIVHATESDQQTTTE